MVKSVNRGLAEGDPIFMLQHRVQKFPSDLKKFFHQILVRADAVYKAQAYQALKLAFMFAQESGPFQETSTFVDFWLIGQSPFGLSDPEFAYNTLLKEVTQVEVIKMINRTKNMLCSACKDLLCVAKTALNPLTTKVAFLHRTVYDFLADGRMQQLLDEGIPEHFKSTRIFHLLNLARVKLNFTESIYGISGEPVPIRDVDVATNTSATALIFVNRNVRNAPRIDHSREAEQKLEVWFPERHMNLYRGSEPYSAPPPAIDTVGEMSISAFHPDTCLRYLQDFAAAVLAVSSTTFWSDLLSSVASSHSRIQISL